MIRDANVQNPTAVVRQHQEDVQDLEADRRDGEEVDGYRGGEVILEERAPRLRRWFPTAHVLADAALTDVDAEFEQLAMDAWCAPERILAAHSADQLADVVRHRWAVLAGRDGSSTSKTAGTPCDAMR